MNIICRKCNGKTGILKSSTNPDVWELAQKNIYICKNCRKDIIMKELRRIEKNDDK